MQAALELSNRIIDLPLRAKKSLKLFSKSTGLREDELKVLEFFVCRQIEAALIDTCRVLDKFLLCDSGRYLSKMLDLPQSTVERCLALDGPLRICGLLVEDIPNNVVFTSTAAARLLFYKKYNEVAIMKEFGVAVPDAPKLSLIHYPHLKDELGLLSAHLKRVTQKKCRGVNILLHGVPSTGKTQLTRTIGQEVEIPVFEINTSTGGKFLISPEDRLENLSFADTFLSNSPSLLVFDETEDVFNSSFTERSTASSHKGCFNQILERNRCPVFWISNTIWGMDPAFTRRFDMIIEVPVPRKAERRAIVDSVIGDLIDAEWAGKIAAEETIAPAVLERAGNVIRSVNGKVSRSQQGKNVAQLLSSTLKAQGHADPFRRKAGAADCKHYNLDFLNTSQDLGSIAKNLRSNPSARLCLHGPAGTGKTSFGHWLAAELDLPLITKKASELLDPYLGMTEKHIAAAFEEAASEGAILLIDEVDSFLAERTQSRKFWEITAVNEMLTQIESFTGIMIASTNRLEALDPASLRRFDLKLYFDYLRAEQVGNLLKKQCRLLGLPKPSANSIRAASKLTGCTPGDFALTARRHRFAPFAHADDLIVALKDELIHKNMITRPIGFI